MGRAFLTAYYVLFYSIGVASLIYALILRITADEPLLGRFIACTGIMAAVTLIHTVRDSFGADVGRSVLGVLRWLELALLSAYAFFLVDFAAKVFPFRRGRSIRLLALGASIACLAACAWGIAVADSRWIDAAVLAAKDAAILGAVAMALLPRGAARPGSEDVYRSFLRYAGIATAIVAPFMLWEEAASLLGAFDYKIRGSLSLPACFGAWSASFIAAHLRHGVPRTEPGSPPAALGAIAVSESFLARYSVTPREGEVLDLLVLGLSYKGIMARLAISMPTVKTHVSSLYRKTGTANRLELANLVQKNELPAG
jgi:DNA-binding CsgD family transcriptional regulator